MLENVAKGTAGTASAAASTLHVKVLEQLRSYFYEGNLAIGARVPERELCQAMSVSRTPLREALKVLASEGVIELLPNRGARLRSLSEQDIVNTFEVIGGLEAMAGKLACERITQEEVDELEDAHLRMYRYFLRSELSEYFKLNQEIHAGIIAAARNSVLQATYLSISSTIKRFRYSANFDIARDRWGAAMREHEAMIDALRRRAGSELSEILFQHLRNKCSSALACLEEEQKRTQIGVS